ncbi:MAG: glutamine synthetase, partial [Burkholderia multivorans]|nr:glutamine synthetase [Burkholderia multivorans]
MPGPPLRSPERADPLTRTNMQDIEDFLKKHRITEIEAIIPDMAGIARGKITPRNKFTSGESMRLPQAVMVQTVTG